MSTHPGWTPDEAPDTPPPAIPIGAAATQKVSGTRTGWGHTGVTTVDDTVTVWAREAPPEACGSRRLGTERSHPGTVQFRATMAGWHRVRVATDPNGELNATATHEGYALEFPLEARPADGVYMTWLDPRDEPPTRTAARDLARYFILAWTNLDESVIARAVENAEDDIYPALSEIGLENEARLKRLATEPETLYADEWDQLDECGRLVIETIENEDS